MTELLAERCLDLLAIPSVTGDERAITDALERWARALKGRPRVLRLGNGLVVGAPDGHRPAVALVGHTDTVPPHPDGGPPQRAGDHLIGLGASDMKGALAVMQLLAEELDLAALPFALLLVFYDREEGPNTDNGLQPLLDGETGLREVDFAIAMEPTDNALQLGCVGSLHARVRVPGRAAHSARPWQGDNAVHKAWVLLKELAERGSREAEVAGLVFRDAMSVTLAQGGRAKNVIPDAFELNVNYRFPPQGSVEQAIARATAEVVRVVGTLPEASVEIVDIAPPGPVPSHNPILAHLQSHGDLAVEPKQAWTDVARLAAAGIDAVNFGPGAPAQAHQRGEWISLAAMAQSYDLLTQALSASLAA